MAKRPQDDSERTGQQRTMIEGVLAKHRSPSSAPSTMQEQILQKHGVNTTPPTTGFGGALAGAGAMLSSASPLARSTDSAFITRGEPAQTPVGRSPVANAPQMPSQNLFRSEMANQQTQGLRDWADASIDPQDTDLLLAGNDFMGGLPAGAMEGARKAMYPRQRGKMFFEDQQQGLRDWAEMGGFGSPPDLGAGIKTAGAFIPGSPFLRQPTPPMAETYQQSPAAQTNQTMANAMAMNTAINDRLTADKNAATDAMIGRGNIVANEDYKQAALQAGPYEAAAMFGARQATNTAPNTLYPQQSQAVPQVSPEMARRADNAQGILDWQRQSHVADLASSGQTLDSLERQQRDRQVSNLRSEGQAAMAQEQQRQRDAIMLQQRQQADRKAQQQFNVQRKMGIEAVKELTRRGQPKEAAALTQQILAMQPPRQTTIADIYQERDQQNSALAQQQQQRQHELAVAALENQPRGTASQAKVTTKEDMIARILGNTKLSADDQKKMIKYIEGVPDNIVDTLSMFQNLMQGGQGPNVNPPPTNNAPADRMELNGRVIVARNGGWVYEDTGEPVQ